MLDIQCLYPLPEFSWSDESNQQPQHITYFDYYGIHYADMFTFDIKHHFGVTELARYKIAIHYFERQQSKGSVVLVHGYMDHVGLYNHLIGALLQAGYNVLAYDLPGHGLSSGEQAGIPDFADYQHVLSALITQAETALPKPWHLVGQSTGGSIAMDYLLNNPGHPFERAVLLAPLVIPKRWLYIKLQLFMIGWFLDAVPRQFVKNSHDDEFLYFLKYQDPLQTRKIAGSWVKALYHWQKHFSQSSSSAIPLLVIQGEQDETVEWKYNLPQIRAKFKNYTEMLVPAAGHHLVKESKKLRETVFSELLDFLNL